MKEVVRKQYHLCMDVVRTSNSWRKTLPYFGRNRKNLVVEKRCKISRKKVPLPMDPPAWRETQVDCSQSRQSFASTGVTTSLEWGEWFPQSGKYAQFLEDCTSRAKVIRAQAPQHRQYALISDFLDRANLIIQKEAALATNWIKDRPEGLQLQNLTLATRTGRSTGSLPENLTADVHHAINKCETLGSGKQVILHGNPTAPEGSVEHNHGQTRELRKQSPWQTRRRASLSKQVTRMKPRCDPSSQA